MTTIVHTFVHNYDHETSHSGWFYLRHSDFCEPAPILDVKGQLFITKDVTDALAWLNDRNIELFAGCIRAGMMSWTAVTFLLMDELEKEFRAAFEVKSSELDAAAHKAAMQSLRWEIKCLGREHKDDPELEAFVTAPLRAELAELEASL